MIKTNIQLSLCTALLLLGSTLANAEKPGEVVEWTGTGGVNWSSGTVFAEGVGVPPARARYLAQKHALACLAAKVDAQVNLLEATQGVRVQAATLVKDFVVESNVVRSTVSGVVKGARVLDKQMEPDGSCRVMLGMSLSGDLAASLYQQAYKQKPHANAAPAIKMASLITGRSPDLVPSVKTSTVPIQADWQKEIGKLNHRMDALEHLVRLHPERMAEGASKGAPTGLIIDARGSNFIPSLAPRVRRIHGSVIYPGSQHQTQAKESGRLISLFMNNLLLAQSHPRVGSRPLVLKALRTWGKMRTELVLGKESSDKLKELIATGFLEDASVIVVLD